MQDDVDEELDLDIEDHWRYPYWWDKTDQSDIALAEQLADNVLVGTPGPWIQDFLQRKLDDKLPTELSHITANGIGGSMPDSYSMFATIIKLIRLDFVVTAAGQWYY